MGECNSSETNAYVRRIHTGWSTFCFMSYQVDGVHCEWSLDPSECCLATYEAKQPLGPEIQAKQMHMSGAYMQDEAPAVSCVTKWMVCIGYGLYIPYNLTFHWKFEIAIGTWNRIWNISKENSYVRHTCAVFTKQFLLSWSTGHRHWKYPLDPWKPTFHYWMKLSLGEMRLKWITCVCWAEVQELKYMLFDWLWIGH